MRSAHRRAGWALAAAGSFGLALSALAQQTTKPAINTQSPVAVSVAGPAAVDEARRAEIQVELAWLADPMTFPCQLAAHKVGASLEVGGFVPNEPLRERALDLARKESTLPIVDKLVVHPNSTLPIVPDTHQHLSQAAATVLGRSLSKYGERFEFSADARGQITINGNLPSLEEKLNVSRRLSQLPGCTSVVNNFVIKVPDAKPSGVASADTKAAVPIMMPANATVMMPAPAPTTVVVTTDTNRSFSLFHRAPAPTMVPVVTSTTTVVQQPTPAWPTAAVVQQPMSARPTTTAGPQAMPARPTTTVQQAMPATSQTVVQPHATVAAAWSTTVTAHPPQQVKPAQPVQQVAGATPYGLVKTPAVPQQVAVNQPKPAMPYAAASNVKPIGYQVPAKGSDAARAAALARMTAQAKAQPATQSANPYASPYSGKAPVPAAPKTATAQAPAVLPPGMSNAPVVSRTTVPYKPQYMTTVQTTTAKPTITQTVATIPVQTTTAKPTITQTVATMPVQTTAAKPTITQTVATMPVQTTTAKPTITQTVATMPAPNPLATPSYHPATPARPASPMVPALTGGAMTPQAQVHVLKRIEEVSGGTVREPRIQCMGSNQCVIQIKVHSRTEALEVEQKIMNLPELAPYKVDLQVQVQP